MNRTMMVLMAAGALAASHAAFAQDEPDKPAIPGRPGRVDPPGLPSSEPLEVVDRVMQAHNSRAWRAHPAFSCNIRVEFGGLVMLQGSMLVDTSKDRVRLDLQDGTKLVWDGETAWVSPADAAIESPRYHLRTWPFFLKAPFALRDAGVKIEKRTPKMLDGRMCNQFKITFDESAKRDTPEDWFIGFSDIGTHTLAAMAYINTWGGRSVADAEREPHIVYFEDPAIVNSVVIPRTWSFYHWNESQGKFGEQVGEVKLTDIAFAQIREGTFDKPEGAREAPMPKAEDSDSGDEGDDEGW